MTYIESDSGVSFYDEDLNLLDYALKEAGKNRGTDMPTRLTGGYTGARVYRVYLSDKCSIIARIDNKQSIVREVDKFAEFVYSTTENTNGIPKILYPTSDGVPSSEILENVFAEKAVILYTDEVYSHVAENLVPVSDVTAQEDIDYIVTQCAKLIKRLRENQRKTSKTSQERLDLFIGFYNNKLPASLVVRRVETIPKFCDENTGIGPIFRQYADTQMGIDLQQKTFVFTGLVPFDFKESHCVCNHSYRKIILASPPEKDKQNKLIQAFQGIIIDNRYTLLTKKLNDVLHNPEVTCHFNLPGKDGQGSKSIFDYLEGEGHLDPRFLLKILDSCMNTKRVNADWPPIFWPPSTAHNEPIVNIGLIHGDLHSGNILAVKNQNTIRAISIIDFENINDNAPIAHDLARLETDLLIHHLSLYFESEKLNVYYLSLAML